MKLAGSCRSKAILLRRWIALLKRFSLVCSLASAAVAAGTATTTLLLPTSKFDEFRNGVSTFLYVSTGIVGLPKMLKIPERIAKNAIAIGQYEALANGLYHQLAVGVAADREDVAVFLNSSYNTFKTITDGISLPAFFMSLQTADEDKTTTSQISTLSNESLRLHQILIDDPSVILSVDDPSSYFNINTL